jgi:hypothetical protein
MKDADLPYEVVKALREVGQRLGESSHAPARLIRAAHKVLKKPQARRKQKAAKQQRKRNRR